MLAANFAFEWVRDEAGYEIGAPTKGGDVGATAVGILLYGDLEVRRKGGTLLANEPVLGGNLHEVVAGIPDDPDGIAAFVANYGFLGLDQRKRPDSIQSESIAQIIEARNRLRDAMKAAGQLSENVALWGRRVTKALAMEKDDGVERVNKTCESPTDHALRMLSEIISAATAKNASFEVVVQAAGHKLETRVRPRSLISAAWLSLANSITSGRLCEVCGKPVGNRRTDQIYCSTKCKQKAYDRKRAVEKKAAKMESAS
ncbi:MAG: hypothetical protein IPK59_00600 [Rhodospirillaceae bacterium]|nr:hypothetical protein [Rhodospirillaceae bacterium]